MAKNATTRKAPGKATNTAKAKRAAAASPGFEGFADNDGKFFRALAKHMDRAWFAEHKAEFEQGWAEPMAALLREVHSTVDRVYPDCELSEPKVFRIYRDVRFGADKSPFKTNVSGLIAARTRGKATESPAALYLQLGLETIAAAGLYMMDSHALAAYRRALLDDERGAEIAKLVRALEKRGFRTGAAEELKSAPRGVDPEHPRIELLKKKGLIMMFPPMPEGILASREILEWVVAQAKLCAPLVRWLVYNTV